MFPRDPTSVYIVSVTRALVCSIVLLMDLYKHDMEAYPWQRYMHIGDRYCLVNMLIDR